MAEEVIKDEPDRVISSHDFIEELKNFPVVNRVATGIKGLDDLVDGFGEGELILISGKSGQGKTTLAQNFVMHLGNQDIKSLFFSYEVPNRQLVKKFVQPMPLFYMPRTLPHKSIEWMEKKILEAKVKYGVKAVVIDHLHYIIDLKLSAQYNISTMLGAMVRDFKTLARRHGLIIFVLCHLAKITTERRPTMDDVRDSSLIAGEADTVILIHRTGNKRSKKNPDAEFIFADNTSMLYVDKARWTGNLGRVHLAFENGEFKELG